jgi:hypothetical protein
MTGGKKVKILKQHIWVQSSDRILKKIVNTDVKEQDVCVTYILRYTYTTSRQCGKCHQKPILVSASTTTHLRNVIQIFILLPHYLHVSIHTVVLLYNMKKTPP